MVEQALAAFRARALRIQDALGAEGHRLVGLKLSATAEPSSRRPTGHAVPGHSLFPTLGLAFPAITGGTTVVTVRARGTIRLE